MYFLTDGEHKLAANPHRYNLRYTAIELANDLIVLLDAHQHDTYATYDQNLSSKILNNMERSQQQ